MRRPRAGIICGMAQVIHISVLAGHDHDSDLDGRVNGFHGVVIILEAHGIGPRIIRQIRSIRVIVSFPRAVTFIADLPIFEAALVDIVCKVHPVGCFIGRAGAVIRGDEDAGPEVGGDIHEIAEGRWPTFPTAADDVV